ncbi:aminotransferase class V-fold PLP-dependent enzyme [Streptomyces durbertensis]|uniref:Aminotransferase class V-fold PLP-dependent enzyme n=1 Tax=Streptomyces durbertensis TaxID=2448886 RepID=A0ABR6EAJ8_9ACTN|nr:aminotransferase class V-fold PLP-dependent enzyme [Streptomyces durbertensis]MBB1242102.1 aminotransferase class V-fold PLP-dependent enzyme [Streptomyces durbertensis]
MLSVTEAEFECRTAYLNTATHGLLPARAARALTRAVGEMTDGRLDMNRWFERIEAARSSFARIAGVPAGRVATGTSVAVHVGLVAGSLPAGATVLVAENEFASVVNPFVTRGDLRLRTVPLERLPEAVDAGTDLVAVSAVQSLDGRVADLDGLAAAARDHGCRTLVDATQSAGWLPLDHGAFDYTVCGAYKWLMCPRGVSFLTVPEDGGGLRALHAGWASGEQPWESTYGPVREPARSARRFDEPAPFLPYLAAAESLALVEEAGPAAIGAHDRALADRFRAGLASLGLSPVPAEGAIVSLPGAGEAGAKLAARAGAEVSVRAGNLRAAFHLYNTADEVDRLLEALSALPSDG